MAEMFKPISDEENKELDKAAEAKRLESMRPFTREELQTLEARVRHAIHPFINKDWKISYENLAYALNVLDAFFARSQTGVAEQDVIVLPPDDYAPALIYGQGPNSTIPPITTNTTNYVFGTFNAAPGVDSNESIPQD